MDATVWLIGDVDAAEFSQAAAWLCERTACSLFRDPRDAIAQASTGLRAHDPSVILFCAIRPGSISQAHVDALRRSFPLARLVALVGKWCEGEMRSGRPWPGVVRIYWHQWQTRLPETMEELDGAKQPRLPPTATDVDALLSLHGRARRANAPARVGIVTARRTDFESLAGTLKFASGHCSWFPPAEDTMLEPLDLLLMDAAGDLAAAAVDLERARSRLGKVPALVLGQFPRPDEVRELLAAPRTAFLAKPFLIRDLLLCMAVLLDAAVQPAHSPASAAA